MPFKVSFCAYILGFLVDSAQVGFLNRKVAFWIHYATMGFFVVVLVCGLFMREKVKPFDASNFAKDFWRGS
jgi:ABC-type thiamin/hydroxymethylpyrimidine transport system permease subunit